MIIAKVQNFIQQHNLIPQGSKVLVGVSGGTDSMALLFVLHKLGYRCKVAHMNFGLRAIDADEDEEFVRSYASKIGIPFFTKKVNTVQFAKTNGISIEMAARELRYRFFSDLLVQHHIKYLAVGHHKNDLSETMLINLTRGTGVRGLSGIKAKNGNTVRPLLCVDRADLSEFVRLNEIPFRTDVTNADVDIIRNKIRHEIVPLFRQINPSFLNSMAENAERFLQAQHLIDHTVKVFKANYVKHTNDQIIIDAKGLAAQIEPGLVLHELIHPLGFNGAQVGAMIQGLDQEESKEWYSAKNRILRSRGQLVVLAKEQRKGDTFEVLKEDSILPLHPPYQLEVIPNPTLEPRTFTDGAVYFDYDKLVFPLVVRKWSHGDRFVPFGMNGSKKLSDFFIDQKFSSVQKEQARVLCSGLDIIWIIGHRTDERYKVTPQTKTVYKLSKKASF